MDPDQRLKMRDAATGAGKELANRLATTVVAHILGKNISSRMFGKVQDMKTDVEAKANDTLAPASERTPSQMKLQDQPYNAQPPKYDTIQPQGKTLMNDAGESAETGVASEAATAGAEAGEASAAAGLGEDAAALLLV